MNIKKRYAIATTEKLINALDEHNVNYNRTIISDQDITVFYLYENDSRTETIERYIDSYFSIIPALVFSKAEMQDARWYRIMPKYDKIQMCESEEVFRYFCISKDGVEGGLHDLSHREQISPYRIGKAPKWRKTPCIYSEEGNYDDLMFTNNATRELLQNEGFSGLGFAPVMNTKKAKVIVDDIWQLKFKNVLPDEAVVNDAEHGITETLVCANCGETRFCANVHLYLLYLYSSFLDEKQDVYITNATFSHGFHIVVISKRLYGFMCETGLEKCFNIHPVKVI